MRTCPGNKLINSTVMLYSRKLFTHFNILPSVGGRRWIYMVGHVTYYKWLLLGLYGALFWCFLPFFILTARTIFAGLNRNGFFTGLCSFHLFSRSHFDPCLCILMSQQMHSGTQSSAWPSQQTVGRITNTLVWRAQNGSNCYWFDLREYLCPHHSDMTQSIMKVRRLKGASG